ncbi:alpha/beta hydrolase [Thalassotalea castellviae]|uniref:Alpha/beta hydrolase n=1 Tax=Thalassotalea castellviae TaxID=3075612 RepID=A0ABU3A365_9GAMM|nr:alpha/beta hydrolase [Thalassotalea sp. W431]MDT0604380.1 alpha/beta hydrolase [Thalassotalea sp. W431]
MDSFWRLSLYSKNYTKVLILLCTLSLLSACALKRESPSQEQLIRKSYISQLNNQERDYFLYLPKGYFSEPDKKWPVMMFLHGNGERGNGKDELDFVLKHGPVYQAWIQKQDLPFIIISPQLHMFDFDQRGIGYIDNRKYSDIPQRQTQGTPPSVESRPQNPIIRTPSLQDMSEISPLLPLGWDKVELDLINILSEVSTNYNVNKNKTYLTGLSYGGFGTWFMASQYPNKFAAIAPVVGWGHPDLMQAIAAEQLPIWQFAGGHDNAVEIQYFYAGIEKLRELGHNEVRFTVHEDMGHDAWKRVYASSDFYEWLLSHSLK